MGFKIWLDIYISIGASFRTLRDRIYDASGGSNNNGCTERHVNIKKGQKAEIHQVHRAEQQGSNYAAHPRGAPRVTG